jgi:hypothetical protein
MYVCKYYPLNLNRSPGKPRSNSGVYYLIYMYIDFYIYMSIYVYGALHYLIYMFLDFYLYILVYMYIEYYPLNLNRSPGKPRSNSG